MLSKADVAQALVIMKRFDRFMEVDDIAVMSWRELLGNDIPDAEVLRESVMRTYRTSIARVTPAHILATAIEVIEERNDQLQSGYELDRDRALTRLVLGRIGRVPADMADAEVVEEVTVYGRQHMAELVEALPAHLRSERFSGLLRVPTLEIEGA